MKKTIVFVALCCLAAFNIHGAANNPAAPAPAKNDPAASPAPKDSTQDPGVRKLSRRERKERIAKLSDTVRQFLTDVDPIMQPTELDTFLILESDAQRDRYIEEFWRRRDPNGGRDADNEYRRSYYDRLQEAKEKFKYLTSDRARIYLIQGTPIEMLDIDCDRYLQPIQLWKYGYLEGMGHSVTLLFYIPRRMNDYRLWQAQGAAPDALAELLSQEVVGSKGETAGVQSVFLQSDDPMGGSFISKISMNCKNGDEILEAINQTQQNNLVIGNVFHAPEVKEEDVNRMLRTSVLADASAKKLTAQFSAKYPARRGGLTEAEITLLLPKSELTPKDLEGTFFYAVDVTGEVLREGKMFESFRYRFNYPAATLSDQVPVVFERYLRPNEYLARVKVSDANARAEAIVEQKLEVPTIEEAPGHVAARQEAEATVGQIQEQMFSSENQLRIAPLGDELMNGIQHIETLVTGDAIKSVEFYLDGKKAMTKRTAPFTLDLDLGDVPQPRKIKAVGLDEKGKFVSGDEIIVNAGAEPFRVRIVSPRVATNLKGKVRVEIDARAPAGKSLASVDLYFNETRLATMYAPPYIHTITIPENAAIGYLRAVATLEDDPTQQAEDIVFVNTPEYLEQVEVHLVELPTTVISGSKHLNDLPESAFKVLDEGKPVKIAKFEHVKNLPLSIGMAIDTSASMQPRMQEAQRAGVQFFKSTLRPGDKAFEVSFDSQPTFTQKWTSSLADLNAGLASLRAEESTALYDAIVYSLYQFKGVKGQKALVVITDGKDTRSKFTFEQSLEFAKRSGIPIYVVGIGIRETEVDTRYKMGRFAAETGGSAYQIHDINELAKIYEGIQSELRSQYLLGFYPPSDVKPGSKWREVTVQTSEGKAKTIRGYYP
jgi:Ca-activated chloride channel homolog